jgi:hypothetical protein
VARDRGRELRKGWLGGRCTRFDRRKRAFVAIERRQSCSGGKIAFVRKVVGSSREAVDRGNGRAQAFGHEPRRDRKVFVMSDRHAKSGALRRKHYISSEKARRQQGVFLASQP